MKILQIIQKQQLRGVEVFASQMATLWQEEGHDVCIAVLQPGQAVIPFRGRVEVIGVNMSSRFVDWHAWKKIAGLIREFAPDVVHANAADTLKYAVMSRLFFRWKQPILYRNGNIMSDFFRNAAHRFYNKLLLNYCDHVVSVSEEARKDMLSFSGLDESKVSVIPVGISTDNAFLSSERGLAGRILHMGAFVPEKNHKGLLRIFGEVRKAYPQIKLVLVGSGPLEKEVRETIRSSGLEGSVELTGPVPNPLDYIHQADLLLMPSIIEGLPAVILEAFWCKTPVVAYKVGGIGEVVRPGETGWLVKKGDEAACVEAIAEVLECDEVNRSRIVENAKSLVAMDYNNKILAKRFLDIFSKVIQLQRRNG